MYIDTMLRLSFKQMFLAEWVRLNPKFCTPNEGTAAYAKHVVLEVLYGYFAPLGMAWWLLRWAGTRLVLAAQR
jgi:hypothetical protein